MKRDRILSISAFVLAAIMLFSSAGCNTLNSSDNNSGTSSVTGRVVTYNQSGSVVPVPDATITLSQILNDGTLSTVSNSRVQSDQTGSFTIKTNLSGYHYLVVSAQKNDITYRSMVDEPTSSNNVVYSSPVTTESTVETNLFLQTVSQLPYAYISLNNHIRTVVNSEIANTISSDNTSLSTLATAFLQREDARIQMLISATYIGTSVDQINNIEVLQNDAAVSLDNSLYTNYNNQDSVKADYERYFSALSYAYIQSSLTYIDFIEVNNASDQVLTNTGSTLAASLLLQLKKQSNIFMTYAIGKEIKAQLIQTNASSSLISNAESALITLQMAFENGATMTDLSQAYTTYREKILEILKTVYASDTSSITAIDNLINGSGGLKSQLQSSVNMANESTVIRSFISYFNSINSAVKTNLSSATNTEITVITNIMKSVNLLL